MYLSLWQLISIFVYFSATRMIGITAKAANAKTYAIDIVEIQEYDFAIIESMIDNYTK